MVAETREFHKMFRHNHPRVDAFVTAFEGRLAAFRTPEPEDPVARRAHAAAFDEVMSRELEIEAIPVATEEHTVPVEGYSDVRVRVYWPTEDRAAPGSRIPVFVAMYGGAFTIAGIDWTSWDALFRYRAAHAGIIIVAVNYSHAPEVTFPAQPEQCFAAFEWAVTQAYELGADSSRMGIGGASSGGNLAAAVTLMNRDRRNHPLRLQLLENAALDLTMGSADMRGLGANIPGIILRKLGARLVRDYVGPSKDTRKNPYASPLLAEDLSGLPPAVIYTAELDALRGDGEAYAHRLMEAGIPTAAMRYIGQTHTSGGLNGVVPAADHQRRDIITALRTLHDSPAVYPDPKA